jgi:hypothetical protein
MPDIAVERLNVVTEAVHEFPADVKFCIVANDTYYAFTIDGKSICMDFRRGGVIYERSLDADTAVYDEDNDRVIISKGGQRKIVNQGNALEYEYVSPDLHLDSDEPKRLRSMFINATGDVEVTVFVDGESRFTATSKGTNNRRFFLAPGLVGDYFRFGFKAKEEVRRATIEYSNMQRQR